ncbi:MAG: hypothetical protein M1829_004827 [Trizodia sp. TS-e1964]|nr:MAG: hypothetical protein M1829_004827 [Trizodia sp. TS-e1964]
MLLSWLLSSNLLLTVSVSALPTISCLQQRDGPSAPMIAGESAASDALNAARSAVGASSEATPDEKYAVMLAWQQDAACDLADANSADMANQSGWDNRFADELSYMHSVPTDDAKARLRTLVAQYFASYAQRSRPFILPDWTTTMF